jgi:hypothetical protein
MLDQAARSDREHLVARDQTELASLNCSEGPFDVHLCHLQMTQLHNESTGV